MISVAPHEADLLVLAIESVPEGAAESQDGICSSYLLDEDPSTGVSGIELIFRRALAQPEFLGFAGGEKKAVALARRIRSMRPGMVAAAIATGYRRALARIEEKRRRFVLDTLGVR